MCSREVKRGKINAFIIWNKYYCCIKLNSFHEPFCPLWMEGKSLIAHGFPLESIKKKICGFPLALVVFTTLVKPCNVVDKMWWYQVSYLIILLSANNIIFQRCNIMFTTYLICLLHMYLVSLLYIFIIAVISLVPNFFIYQYV